MAQPNIHIPIFEIPEWYDEFSDDEATINQLVELNKDDKKKEQEHFDARFEEKGLISSLIGIDIGI